MIRISCAAILVAMLFGVVGTGARVVITPNPLPPRP